MKNVCKYLNPKNLLNEIHIIGYHYSWKQYIYTNIGVVAVLVLIAKILSLSAVYTVILGIIVILCEPYLVLNGYVNMYEQKRFMDVSNYMEQMLYSFKQKSKIMTALEDSVLLFPDSLMGECIDLTMEHISTSDTEGNVYQESFEFIEKEYGCELMKRIHTFMIRVETNGGEYEASARILISDKNKWVSRVMKVQKEKQLIKRNVTIGIFLALIVVVGTVYMVPKELVDISQNKVSQFSGFCMLACNFILWTFVQCKLTGSWIKMEDTTSLRKLKKYYANVMSSPKRCKKSQRDYLIKEVEKAFPDWILSVSLLLQTENVQMAIVKSVEKAPFIICSELECLIEKLERLPNSIEPYLEFFGALQLANIQSSMRMLFSMSINGGEDMTEQIYALIERNGDMQDQSEKIKLEDYLAGISFCVLVPMIFGSMKLMVDMSLLMIGIMQNAKGVY